MVDRIPKNKLSAPTLFEPSSEGGAVHLDRTEISPYSL